MTAWEKSSLLLYLSEERLYEWLAFLLCDKDAPLTLNSIVFILDLSRRLTLGSPKEIRIAVVISTIYRKKSFTRAQIARFLSEVNYYLVLSFGRNSLMNLKEAVTGWFSIFWATKIKMALEKNKNLAQEQIPVSWCRFEAEGSAWLDSFEERIKYD